MGCTLLLQCYVDLALCPLWGGKIGVSGWHYE